MGKKLSISQPTVINLELSPLSDTFWLDTNGESVEQWYSVNEKIFAPDRKFTPLIISPKLSVVDTLTAQKYENVTIYSTEWTVLEKTEEGWQENVVAVNASIENLQNYLKQHDYVKHFNKLYVTKNNKSAENPITIKCVATYLDPRDSGRQTKKESSVILSTSVDATIVYPKIQILFPATTTYNPLVSESSIYTLKAQANWEGVPYEEGEQEGSERGKFVWNAIDKNGNEVPVEQMPYYVEGQGTDEIKVDAMYDENAQVVLRIKRHENDVTLLPPKASVNIVWVTTPIQGVIVSENGNALRGTSTKFSFYTIVNTNSGQLSDEKIRENLRFQWKKRPATAKKTGATVNPSTETFINLGWGERIEIKADDMMSFGGTRKSSSAMITNDIYLLGAYSKLQYNGEDITLNDEKIYERTI
jgi:hypothetical protein